MSRKQGPMSASKQAKPMAAEGNDFSLKAILPPLMAIIVGMIMVILDSTVVNNAIPKLVEYFNTDLKTIQWTVTGYTLALSAVIPLAGWLTDKFGSKQIFMITIALFTIGSVLCGIAQSPEQLIIYRIIQGLGGGMVSPIGMAMVFKLAPSRAPRIHHGRTRHSDADGTSVWSSAIGLAGRFCQLALDFYHQFANRHCRFYPCI